jgi:hypothetical protein
VNTGLCDVPPSRFDRFANDQYFTIDAPWIIPALCRVVKIEGPILEPCAGRGDMVRELRGLGFDVLATDLYAYENPLVPDIETGVDIFNLRSLLGYRWLITNLPYGNQNRILAHVLPIAARDDCNVATLARSEWTSAKERNALVHENSCFAGEIALTKRPKWIEHKPRDNRNSARHPFSWFIWSPKPLAEPFLRFSGPPANSMRGRPTRVRPGRISPFEGRLTRDRVHLKVKGAD